jgi:hypothetical protein
VTPCLRLPIRFAAALALAAAAFAGGAVAHGPAAQLGSVSVSAPWARASAGMAKAGAAYMTLDNTGSEPATVVGCSTPIAAACELHTHTMDGDVMRMRQVPEIVVPAGETVALEPGGLHVMLMGLAAPLSEGDTLTVSLTLVGAAKGRVDVAVPVQGIGSSGPAPHTH